MKKPRLYFLNLFVSMILRMQRGSMQYTHLDDTLFGTSYAIYRMNMKLPCNTLKVRLKFLDTCEQKKNWWPLGYLSHIQRGQKTSGTPLTPNYSVVIVKMNSLKILIALFKIYVTIMFTYNNIAYKLFMYFLNRLFLLLFLLLRRSIWNK